jgi:hypothetical protein
MKSNSIKRRAVAVLLLLVFFQQMGAGLYIHNLFHNNEESAQIETKQAVDSKEINIACSCVDNFLMPFVDADVAVSVGLSPTHIKPFDSFSERVYFTSLIFSSLRGPPVV